MPDYKLYSCQPDGHFSRRLDFESPDDDSAVAEARGLLTTLRGELWTGPRKICEFGGRQTDGDEASSRPRPEPRAG